MLANNTAKRRAALGTIDDPVLERDVLILAKRYLKGTCFFDMAANLPVFIFFYSYTDGLSEK